MDRQQRRAAFARHLGYAAMTIALLAPAGTRAAEEAPPVDVREADTLGTPPATEEAAATGPNRGRLSFTLTNDFTTAYFFRGILQERNGFIWEPAAGLNFNLWNGGGALRSVGLGFDIWNSFQTAKTGATGGPTNLYETDYTPNLTLGWSGGLETSVAYNVYTSPNGAFDTTQEVAVALAYDDSDLLGAWSMKPTATFAIETSNSSFLAVANDKKGGYAEFGVEPSLELSLPFDAAHDYPVTAGVPLAVGISLYDYYNDGIDNPVWGFASFGLSASVPLAFIPEDFGAWSAGAAVNVLVLNDTLKAINSGDNPYPVGTLSLSMEY